MKLYNRDNLKEFIEVELNKDEAFAYFLYKAKYMANRIECEMHGKEIQNDPFLLNYGIDEVELNNYEF
jgi:hypothetical protein